MPNIKLTPPNTQQEGKQTTESVAMTPADKTIGRNIAMRKRQRLNNSPNSSMTDQFSESFNASRKEIKA